MGYTVIHKKEQEHLSDMIAEMMSIGGQIKTRIESLGIENDRMGMRDDMGMRSDYRDGMGMRDGGSYGNRGNGYGDRDEYEPVIMYRRRR